MNRQESSARGQSRECVLFCVVLSAIVHHNSHAHRLESACDLCVLDHQSHGEQSRRKEGEESARLSASGARCCVLSCPLTISLFRRALYVWSASRLEVDVACAPQSRSRWQSARLSERARGGRGEERRGAPLSDRDRDASRQCGLRRISRAVNGRVSRPCRDGGGVQSLPSGGVGAARALAWQSRRSASAPGAAQERRCSIQRLPPRPLSLVFARWMHPRCAHQAGNEAETQQRRRQSFKQRARRSLLSRLTSPRSTSHASSDTPHRTESSRNATSKRAAPDKHPPTGTRLSTLNTPLGSS